MAPRFECEHCYKIFKSKESRHHHLAKYHDYEPIIYKCEKCPKTFKYKDNLIVHMSDGHQQSNMRYECGQCASSFKYYHHLRQHIMFVHDPNKKPFKCHECSKVFIRRDVFAQHMKYVHSQTITLHRCELCNKIYKSKFTLQKHISVNHDENFKRSACPLCPSDFKWPHHLKQHINKVHIKLNIPPNMKVQTNRCSLCFLLFNEKFEMLIHMRSTHNLDVDIYKCCQCTAVFNLKEPFLRHLETHEENKGEHKCEQCHPILNPKKYVDNKVQNEDYGLRPEDEIVDFEEAIMEDLDLRELIRYKLRHADKSGTFNDPDSKNESDEENSDDSEEVMTSEPIVELTIGSNIENLNYAHENLEIIQKDMTVAEHRDENMTVGTPGYSNSSCISKVQILENHLDNSASIEKIAPEIEACVITNKKSLNDESNSQVILESSLKSSKFPKEIMSQPESTKKSVLSSDSPKKLMIQLQRIDVNKTSKCIVNTNTDATKISNFFLHKTALKCNFCSETFIKPVDFARHIKLKHTKIKKSQNKVFKCRRCSASFGKLHLLSFHYRSDHKTNVNKSKLKKQRNAAIVSNSQNTDLKSLKDLQIEDSNTNVRILSPEQSPTREQKCGKCELYFSSKLDLLRHISSTHLNIKNVKSSRHMKKSAKKAISVRRSHAEQFLDEALSKENPTEPHSVKSYVCKTCNLNFATEADFTQHMKMQHRHKCGICSIAFVHKEKLNFHLLNEHKDRPKEHRCEVCSVVFKLAASLAKHIDEKHQDRNVKEPRIVTKDMKKVMHKCVNCGALFPLRESLQRHIQLEHDTGSVHKCGECTAVFNDMDEFKEHLLIEHMQN